MEKNASPRYKNDGGGTCTMLRPSRGEKFVEKGGRGLLAGPTDVVPSHISIVTAGFPIMKEGGKGPTSFKCGK